VQNIRGGILSENTQLSSVKVVLIDDSNTIRRSAEKFLSQEGCQVVLAEDGFDGLSKVVDTDPDIIFVDVMMPRLDGYQICALIKKHPHYKNVPVVMLTSKDTLFDRARGKLVGADQYLTKPFNKKNLIETVINHTQQQEEHDHGY
jgi:twitching motility two-component system response regulator PilG